MQKVLLEYPERCDRASDCAGTWHVSCSLQTIVELLAMHQHRSSHKANARTYEIC